METTEIVRKLNGITDMLPAIYSQSSARELKALFERYKSIAQGLSDEYSQTKFGLSTEFSDIEHDIDWAIKGTPKKEAEARFYEAREHLIDNIESIIREVK